MTIAHYRSTGTGVIVSLPRSCVEDSSVRIGKTTGNWLVLQQTWSESLTQQSDSRDSTTVTPKLQGLSQRNSSSDPSGEQRFALVLYPLCYVSRIVDGKSHTSSPVTIGSADAD